ncbi:phage endoprotease [Sulfurimicrobium lacus]|uniref:Phage endoprotease n=1 Tax=Sulfurimicrobium lacus TaxID=2715678 RepID=A0A6F8VD24_9PROT|nr:hypothetical protein [Sulfurimicrobium lacus]BCB27051.1 phage endoprotease [Sulfurimicrobium lacus]
MTTETMITAAAKTTESADASGQATQQAATGAEAGSQQQQATEGQGTQGQQAEGTKTEGDQQQQENKPEGAPENYEFKAPEGQQFDDTVIGAFSEVAKELNLPQDAAQKVLDKMAPVIQARHMEQFEAARAQWAETAKSDKEFGGEKLDENLAMAKKAIDTFGTPEFRALLNDSGFGNHPEVIRVFYRAGKAISEDRFVAGSGGGKTPQSVAQRMYPGMNP